jgi:hypothetical protein
VADGGGARPKSKRGRGFRWSEGVVQAWEAVGNGVALERGVGEVWVMEEGTAFRARFETVGRRRGERGKGRERGVRPWECHAVRGGVVGPGPNRRAALGSGPSAARAGIAGRKQRVRN